MKRLSLLLAAMAVTIGASAEVKPYWQDPEVNRVNTLAPRASFFSFENEALAHNGEKYSSSRFMSIEGDWNFCFAESLADVPTTFYDKNFNDAQWAKMHVPGMIELNGYGTSIYSNKGYAWRTIADHRPPYVPDYQNYVGLYRNTFEIPASWNGEQIVLHVGSATSNLRLWVNGREVGYSEDSKDAAEFDITDFVRAGQSALIAMQVMRWCDGTYLEDQDFWRFTGIAREVYLYSRPKAHISDVNFIPDLTDNYTNGVLNIKITTKDIPDEQISMTLVDADGRTIASGKGTNTTLRIKRPHKWSAETPYLYTLLVRNGKSEYIPFKVGFRKVEIRNSQLLVNGKPILIKGVNRHELDPETGYVVDMERMLQDIRVIKELNMNAVRTCHYPDDPRWYDLCDKYGIYLVAEANIESHGMGYGERTLAKVPIYEKAHIERNEINIRTQFNHPSIIVWSLGNEAGYGPSFEKAYDAVKAWDSSRPIQYERAEDEGMTDIFCPMYYPYDKCEAYCKNDNPRPLIQCEYAHAMGNSCGGFKEYWDLIRSNAKYQGGFIWDFADQGLHGKSKVTGKDIYTYGGDYGRYPTTDHNFNCNGVLNPDRIPNPHAYEIQYFYQNYWVKSLDVQKGELTVFDEDFFYTPKLDITLTLLADGDEVGVRTINNVTLRPQQNSRLRFEKFDTSAYEGKELLCNVDIRLAESNNILVKGCIVASYQQSISPYLFPKAEAYPQSTDNAKVDVKDWLTLTANNISVTFNKKSGWIDYIDKEGKPLLEEGTSLRPTFWRAPTDNDYGTNYPKRLWDWRHPQIKLASITYDNGCVRTTHLLEKVGATLNMEYSLTADGKITVCQRVEFNNDAQKPQPLVVGMELVLTSENDTIKYYGRGPWENYIDRKTSQFIGIYQSTVSDEFYAYVRPQECGNHTDVRWAEVESMRFVAIDKPMDFQALHFSTNDLDDGSNKKKHQSHSGDLTPRAQTFVRIATIQMGLGCVNSWGAEPRNEYQTGRTDREFSFVIEVK